MSESKRELRAERKAAREASERAQAASKARRRRLLTLGGMTGVAAIILAVAIAISASGGATEKPGTSDAAQLVEGIEENDGVLGDPKAPITVTEYLDPQCPVCAEASKTALPHLINTYVKPGKVKLGAATMSFLGPDSVRAAKFAAGAKEQGKLWAFLETFYASQGTENSGYVTDDFLRRMATGIEGLDPARALAARESAPVTEELERAQERTRLITGPDGGYGTPSFLVGPTGGDLELVQLQTLGLEDLRGPIEEAER